MRPSIRPTRHLAAVLALIVAAAGCDSVVPVEPVMESPNGPAAHVAPAGTRVLHVPRDYPTLQAAVDAAREGDLVQVREGIYNENVVITQSNLQVRASAKAVLDGTGIGGIGIHVLGTQERPVTGVEIAGFEVRNFVRGIMLQWSEHARIHRNEVHSGIRGSAPGALDGRGIILENTQSAVVSQNLVHGNEGIGLTLWTGSAENLVRGNRVHNNGYAVPDRNGNGLVVTGAGSHNNRILENEVVGNNGRGIAIQRPPDTDPIVGNVAAQNRVHKNERGGIVIMFAATETILLQNDARGNALSGLAPCGNCDLVDLSIGGNTWERNRGRFNLTEPCGPQG
jgi:parallel beta-helix repeat protein